MLAYQIQFVQVSCLRETLDRYVYTVTRCNCDSRCKNPDHELSAPKFDSLPNWVKSANWPSIEQLKAKRLHTVVVVNYDHRSF